MTEDESGNSGKEEFSCSLTPSPPETLCGTLLFSHGNRRCTFAERREEMSMVQQVGGTMEVEAKILEVPEGLMKGVHGDVEENKGLGHRPGAGTYG